MPTRAPNHCKLVRLAAVIAVYSDLIMLPVHSMNSCDDALLGASLKMPVLARASTSTCQVRVAFQGQKSCYNYTYEQEEFALPFMLSVHLHPTSLTFHLLLKRLQAERPLSCGRMQA